VQVYLPGVLVQIAFASQGLIVLHSSMSTQVLPSPWTSLKPLGQLHWGVVPSMLQAATGSQPAVAQVRAPEDDCLSPESPHPGPKSSTTTAAVAANTDARLDPGEVPARWGPRFDEIDVSALFAFFIPIGIGAKAIVFSLLGHLVGVPTGPLADLGAGLVVTATPD
jgi:hypothetical protein